jgi:hypothetical protein
MTELLPEEERSFAAARRHSAWVVVTPKGHAVGYFATEEDARQAAEQLSAAYPNGWRGRYGVRNFQRGRAETPVFSPKCTRVTAVSECSWAVETALTCSNRSNIVVTNSLLRRLHAEAMPFLSPEGRNA